MAKTPNILIVGAGPTGLTAAIELARQGIIPTIIEKRKDASNLSRAVGILPSSLKILEPSGVSDALRGEGVFIREANFHKSANHIAILRIWDDNRPEVGILGLAQDRTEAHLEATLEKFGGEVRYGEAFETLSQSGDTVTVQLQSGQTENYDYVIGADGTDSAVRAAIALPYEGIDIPETWSIADVDCPDWKYQGNAALFLKPKGEIQIVVPLEDERYRVISNTKDTLKVLPIPMNVTNIRREGEFKISVRQVPRYNVGNVFLAGDSAHCHSPVGGRGMNLGISDAADLAARMVKGQLHGYSNARHSEGAKIIAGSERARKLVTSANPFKRMVVIAALWIITRLPFMQHRIVKTVTNT